MEKVSLDNAVKNGNMYRIKRDDVHEDEIINGRIKFTNFTIYNLKDFDIDKSKVSYLYQDNNLVRLEYEYVNLCKHQVRFEVLENKLMLEDLDGFTFPICNLDCDIPYESRMNFYQAINGIEKQLFSYFLPKIKIKSEVFFLVPEDEMEYYITIQDGEIEEL